MPAALEGLSAAQAARGLLESGPNEIAPVRQRSLLRIVTETMREPMFLLLIGAAVLYLLLGDLGEGLFLFGGATAAVALVIMEEARSERALAALRELAQPKARVIRSGQEVLISARNLVPGDILLIGEGDRLPADGALVGGEVLSIDESLLTGESAPVTRSPELLGERQAHPPAAGAGQSELLGGSLVVRGQGVVRVIRTGPRSAMGKIGSSLQAIPFELTPLQKTANRLVGILGVFALGFCGLVILAYGLLRHDWIEAVLAGITIAISLIPEEFPMVLAVFLALGAWRLARHRVLVRRSAVIETLGAATVLCVDKTGTLTENRMRVERLWTPQAEWSLAGGGAAPAELVTAAVLASAVRPVDPMDKAIRALSLTEGFEPLVEHGGPARNWPLTPERLAVIQMWRADQSGFKAAAKGAPEAIFSLCGLADAQVERMHAVVARYADQGIRVL
ncbi:MAG TPA: HAD-IC family P-type ATPase, partial [Caulobacteraceae bacterium]|nr:HAD-IC family P-type ATPase [Caulobacteraceae bacterium]